MSSRAGFRGAWMILVATSVLLVSLVDALLLEISRTFFTAGYNTVYLAGAGPIAAFVTSSLLVDLCLVTGIWAVMLALLAGRRGSVLQQLVIVTLVSLAVPLSIDFVRYQLLVTFDNSSLAS